MQKQSLLGSVVLAVASLAMTGSSASAQCQDKLLAGSASSHDQFGWAVAQTPRYAVVGALFEAGSGAAYVYEPAGGGWQQTARLVAAAPTGADWFGSSVAASRGTVVVGAPFGDSPLLDLTGSAHVFTDGRSGWAEDQVLRASDLDEGDQFGFSVAVDYPRMAIGAPSKDISGVPAAGVVYIFEDQGGIWVEVNRLQASDAATDDSFGASVSLSNDTLFVGSAFNDDGASDAGSVYVFQATGSVWNETQKLLASAPGSSDQFGRELSVSGDIAIIGARNDDDAGSNSGAAYAYTWNGASWVFAQKLFATLPSPEDRFGSSVAAGDGLLAAGAPLHDNFGPDRGQAHVFTSTGGGWTRSMTINASDGENFDRFGGAIAIGGGRVLIGSALNDESGSNSGAAYGIPVLGPDQDDDGTLDACDDTPFLNFCFGDGADANGCTSCPCGNDAPSNSWGGCLNGSGMSARVVASGTPSIANSTLRVDMSGATPSTLGILVSGTDQLPRNTGNPCFSVFSGIRSPTVDGLRCAGGRLVRHGARQIDANGDVGTTTNPWSDSLNLITRGGFTAGGTRYYQVFYRDLQTLVCGRGINTTQAFSATYLP